MQPQRLKKRVGKKTVYSNLKPLIKGLAHHNMDYDFLDLKSIRHDKIIQQHVKEHIRQLSGLDK